MTTAAAEKHSDLITLARLQRAGLASAVIDVDDPRWEGRGIGGRRHAKSRTGTAARIRTQVMGVILDVAKDGVVGLGRGSWDKLGLERIALTIGSSRRHTQRAIAELGVLGVVRTEKRHGQTHVFWIQHDEIERRAVAHQAFVERKMAEFREREHERYRELGLAEKPASKDVVPAGIVPRPTAQQQARDELEQLVDDFEQIFQPGSAQNAVFTPRVAARLMKVRRVDGFGLVEEMRDIDAALRHDRSASEVIAVLDKPSLLPHRKMWARLVSIGRRHRTA